MRVLLPIATTLAAVRVSPTLLPPPPPPSESCAAPVFPPPTITDMHIIYPLLIPYAAQAIIHMPTLLLAAQSRVTHIKQALVSVVTVALGVALNTWILSGNNNPPVAYALSLHWALFLLAQPPHPTLAIGAWAHHAVCTLGVAILTAAAWQPPPAGHRRRGPPRLPRRHRPPDLHARHRPAGARVHTHSHPHTGLSNRRTTPGAD
jgi:hypothetical protein